MIKIISYEDHLIEQKLGEVLAQVFSASKIVPQFKVGESRQRVDYMIREPYNLCYEFDGEAHYTSRATQERDERKDKILTDMGFKVVRIPYFIQIRPDTVGRIFEVEGLKVDSSEVKFAHGFIHPKAVRPRDFNYYGMGRFVHDLTFRFPEAKKEVLKTLEKEDAEVLRW